MSNPSSLPPLGHTAWTTRQKQNPFALASLVLSLVWLAGVGSLLGVIFGHIALVQIKRANPPQRGRGLAVAGLALGYLVVGSAVVVGLVAGVGAMLSNSFAPTPDR